MKEETPTEFELNLIPKTGKERKRDPKAKLEEVIQNIKSLVPKQLEVQRILAQVTRSKFEALLEAGFTKDEALFLCK